MAWRCPAAARLCATSHFQLLLPPSRCPRLTPLSLAHAAAQTRGNQRDTDRARAQKRKDKVAAALKGKEDGLTPLQRKERDAKALQEKLAKKAAEDAAKK